MNPTKIETTIEQWTCSNCKKIHLLETSAANCCSCSNCKLPVYDVEQLETNAYHCRPCFLNMEIKNLNRFINEEETRLIRNKEKLFQKEKELNELIGNK